MKRKNMKIIRGYSPYYRLFNPFNLSNTGATVLLQKISEIPVILKILVKDIVTLPSVHSETYVNFICISLFVAPETLPERYGNATNSNNMSHQTIHVILTH
jgi:hypothetical protein